MNRCPQCGTPMTVGLMRTHLKFCGPERIASEMALRRRREAESNRLDREGEEARRRLKEIEGE